MKNMYSENNKKYYLTCTDYINNIKLTQHKKLWIHTTPYQPEQALAMFT